MPPSIWPSTDSGLSARPTSWAVATCTTLTRPSSGSTSTTARWATKANAVWQLPWPSSSSSSVGRWWYSTVSSNVHAVRRVGDRRRAASPSESTTSPPSITSRSGSMPWRRADVLEQPLAHGAAGGVDGAAAHPRLARRRRRPGRADLRVDRLEHDVVDAEHGAGDLLGDRDEPLADLGRGELQRGHAVGEPAARRRVVVEALGVHQVLDRHAPADAAADVPDVGGEPGAAGQAHRVAIGRRRRPASSGIGSAAVSRMHRATGATLSTTCPVISAVAGLHGVAQADLDGVEPARRGQLVHLALVGEARLHDAEPAHRPARQVVGAHGLAVDDGVRAPVRALGVRDGVEQHGRRRRRVGPAVEHEAGLDLDDLAVARWRGGASRSSPGGGGRGRGSSRRGCRPCAPGGRGAAPAGRCGPAG